MSGKGIWGLSYSAFGICQGPQLGLTSTGCNLLVLQNAAVMILYCRSSHKPCTFKIFLFRTSGSLVSYVLVTGSLVASSAEPSLEMTQLSPRDKYRVVDLSQSSMCLKQSNLAEHLSIFLLLHGRLWSWQRVVILLTHSQSSSGCPSIET